MRKETAKYLLEAAEEIGGLETYLDETYSGRGMYGDNTVALICDCNNKDMFQMISIAAVRIKEDEDSEEGLDSYGHEEFTEDVGKIRQDNMGRDNLVFY